MTARRWTSSSSSERLGQRRSTCAPSNAPAVLNGTIIAAGVALADGALALAAAALAAAALALALATATEPTVAAVQAASCLALVCGDRDFAP